VPARRFDGDFERDWSVGSFTSLTRRNPQDAPHWLASDLAADGAPGAAWDESSPRIAALAAAAGMAPGDARVPRNALQAKLLEQQALAESLQRIADEPWHRFPRGSVPGNFLHEQLEWMAHEGFATVGDPQFDARLLRRIERAGWANRQDDALAWLRAIASVPLPPLGAPLSALGGALPELEFWFPSERLSSGALDRLCRRHVLPGVARPALPERRLHGMLKGFMDLVFEHQGRYWVLDYKSNALGGNDSAYHAKALAAGVAEHRYDIQGALYMLALHRLLRSRLGDGYDPSRQMGGAIFFFLRGIGHAPTRGCCTLAPEPGLLDGLDALFNEAP
jgi:exodeoxyribonuclease V beta subunit